MNSLCNNLYQNDILYGNIGDGKYILHKKLGEGGTAKVYLSTIKQNSFREVPVAIKRLNNESKKISKKHLEQLFKNEVESLVKISSDHVLKIYEIGKNIIQTQTKQEEIHFMVLEYAENGDLLHFITECENRGFGENLGRAIFLQIIQGVNDCHKENICHRDLKLSNIMLDDYFRIKIGDFGFSKVANRFLHTRLGTPCYAAPEILSGKPYNGLKADIFSLGICLFHLVFGLPPFDPKNDPMFHVYLSITQNEGNNENVNKFWEQRSQFFGLTPSNEFKDLFIKMIAQNPEKRPSIQEIFKHPWMQMPIGDESELQNEFNTRKTQIDMEMQIKEFEDLEESDDETRVKRGEDLVYEFFDIDSIPYKNEYLFTAQNCLKIKATSQPFDLMNKIVNKIEQKDSENKTINCSNQRKLKFSINYILNNLDEESQKTSDEEQDEILYLTIQVRFIIDTQKGIQFIHFSKKFGSTYDFYNKIKEIKSFLLNSNTTK